MPRYNRADLGRMASESGFVRDTFEKVLRLKEILAKDYIKELLVLTNQEREYLDNFEQKRYKPELLFEESDIVKRVKNHPMALWKCKD